MSEPEQEEVDSSERGSSEVPAVAEEPPEVSPKPAGAIEVRYFGHTDVGLIREHNEDNLLLVDLGVQRRFTLEDEPQEAVVGERGVLLAVCDGMGGAAAGEVASQMAVDTLHEVMQSSAPPANGEDFARHLVFAIEESGHRIFSAAKMDRSRRGMGTTSTVAGLVGGTLFVGQVGDSRAYLLRNGKLSQLSKDQSLVNQLIEAGQLTEEEAEAFEHSNIILQALGTTENVSVDVTYVDLCEGDRLMLCSDGLSGLVHSEMIREVLAETRDIRAACTRLVDMANAGGGHDNITCIVADFSGPGLLPAEGAPAAGYERYPTALGYSETDELDSIAREPTMKSATAKPGADVKRYGGDSEDSAGASSRSPFGAFALLGIGLLAFGALAFLFTRGEPAADPALTARPAARTQPVPVEAPPAQNVELHVRTDVEGAYLFVDGEDLGTIGVDEDVTLEVVPGRYQIEARVGDEVVAQETVEVEEGEPVDVALNASVDPKRRVAPTPAPSGAAPAPSGAAPAPSGAAPAPSGAAPAPSGAAPAPSGAAPAPAGPAPTGARAPAPTGAPTAAPAAGTSAQPVAPAE